VMTSCPAVYYIWYGNWSGNSATSLLPQLPPDLSGSSYWNIVTTYTNSAGTHIPNCLTYGGSTTDSYSQGTTLSDAGVWNVVTRALNNGYLPRSSNAVYYVLTSSDVTESSGFCTQYCGWHTNGSNSGVDIKYAFVGNAARCPSACGTQITSPNGNAGADAMATSIAQQLANTVTDPDGNAWYDSSGSEMADKCASQSGSYIVLGGTEWYLKPLWVNAGTGYCSTHYP
jgi:hypothetical protein